MVIGDLIAMFVIFGALLFLANFAWDRIKPSLKRIKGKRNNAWKRRTLSSKSSKSVKFNDNSVTEGELKLFGMATYKDLTVSHMIILKKTLIQGV